MEVTISADRVYPLMMNFGVKEDDTADRARVAELVGQSSMNKDGTWVYPPGTEIPVRLEIRSSGADHGRVLLDEVVMVGKLNGWSAEAFYRHVGVIRLTPGRYQIKAQNLTDHREFEKIPVFLEMHAWTRGNVFYWSKESPSGRMAAVLDQIHKRDLLNNLSTLARLPDNSHFALNEYPNLESFNVPMPVAVWNGCSFGIFIFGKEGLSDFGISKNCGGADARQVYKGSMRELFRE